MKRFGSLFVALALLGTTLLGALPLPGYAAGPNLIKNPSVAVVDPANSALPQDWHKAKATGVTGTLTYKKNEGRLDQTSVYVNVTKRTAGEAKWRFENVTVKPNATHTYTDYYKSNVQTKLLAEFTSTTGVKTLSAPVTVNASTGWALRTANFTTPANVKTMTVFHQIEKTGWLQTDDFSLVDDTYVAPAPTVNITAPASGATVTGTVPVSANATTTDGTVAGVTFKLDGATLGVEDTTAPYSVNWNTTTTSDGAHGLTATARGSNGQSATTPALPVTVSNPVAPTPPTVTMTAPAAGSTVVNTVTVSANASDQSGGVAGVQFKLDGANLGAEDLTAPYSVSWDTLTAANGAHNLTATARNTSGLTATTTPVNVTVNNVVTPPAPNLVPNPGLETADATNPALPASWVNNKWGTNTATFTYPVAGNGSAKAVRVDMTAYTSGDAKWYFNEQAVEANTTYHYKDTYRSNTATEVIAALTDTAGITTYKTIGSLAASTTWQPITFSFVTNPTTASVTVFHVISSVGYLEIDDISLSEPAPLTGYLPNGSLEEASSETLPLSWTKGSWGTNTPVFEYLTEGRTGNRSVRVTLSNYVDGDAKWMPESLTNLTRGGSYRFTTWYKTNTIPHAVAMYTKDNGTVSYLGLPDPQPNGTTDWQMYSDTFNVPVDAKAVSVFFFISSNGYVQTDDYSIEDYTPVGFNRPMVTLTFDDGEEDNKLTVLPMMGTYGYKSTQCFATDHIEGNPANTQAVLDFFNAGHEICSHTVNHPFLTKVTPMELAYELTHSKSVLEGIIGQPVKNFATPYGDYNATVNTEIAKYYSSHRTVDEGYNSKDNFNGYRIRSQNMFSTTTMEQYQGWLDQAKATNTWLVLVYHRVAEDPGTYDTKTADFAAQLAAIQASGIPVLTWQQALDEIAPQL